MKAVLFTCLGLMFVIVPLSVRLTSEEKLLKLSLIIRGDNYLYWEKLQKYTDGSQVCIIRARYLLSCDAFLY